MKKHILDQVRAYVLASNSDDHPLSPLIVAADLLELPKSQVSLAFWYLQREGLVGKYKPDGYKFEIWSRTEKAIKLIIDRESSQKQAEN
jgi:hypothetical protein